jgi:hypothetical protein
MCLVLHCVVMKLLTLAAELTCSWLFFMFNLPVTLFCIHKLDVFQSGDKLVRCPNCECKRFVAPLCAVVNVCIIFEILT